MGLIKKRLVILIFLGIVLGFLFPVYIVTASSESGGPPSSPPSYTDVQNNLEVPFYYQDYSTCCGPACAQMWIEYKTNIFVDQYPELMYYIRANNLEGDVYMTDPYGLQATMDYYDPSRLHWDQNYTSADSGISDIAQRIETYGAPAATLTGHGTHWMLVKGAYYRKDSSNDVVSVYGVWVHDPQFPINGGIGQNTYVSASDWSTNYFMVVNHPYIPSTSRWYNYWVAVVCPPRDEGTKPSEIYIEPQRGPVSKDEAVQVAIEGLNFHQLFVTEPFAQYLNGAIPNESIYVESIDNNFPNYYLVPFSKGGKIHVVAVVNAELGTFMEAAYSDLGLTKYPVLSAEEASAMIRQKDNKDNNPSSPSIKLVWRRCEQSWRPYVPFWTAEVDGKTIYLGENGQPYEQLSLPEQPPITPIKSELRKPTDSVQIVPTDDAYVSEGHPDNNFGDQTALFVQSYVTGYKNERIFMKFDLNNILSCHDIPADAIIIKARLYLYCWRGRYEDVKVQCYGVNDDNWYENTITWNNQPAQGEMLDKVYLNSRKAENGWYSWDVKSFVNPKFENDGIVSFCLRASAENLAGQYTFDSNEWRDGSLCPYLEITFLVN